MSKDILDKPPTNKEAFVLGYIQSTLMYTFNVSLNTDQYNVFFHLEYVPTSYIKVEFEFLIMARWT